jgi:murein DD-endopeptidase MepM/ murein hydrolase activator NlpD
MRTAFQKARRVVLIVYLIAIHAVLIYFVGERIAQRYFFVEPIEKVLVPEATERSEIPTPLPVPESFADPVANDNTASNTITNSTEVQPSESAGLLIPVVGVRPDQLVDTFTASRSEGRSHDAIDIIAPGGTPVIAAADGEIVRFFDSERGGVTIYQLTVDRKYMLYYAHLQRRADGIAVGMQIRRGRRSALSEIPATQVSAIPTSIFRLP